MAERHRPTAVTRVLTAVCTAALLAVAVAAPPATAADPTAIVDLPGCRANTLPANDDDSTAAVSLGFPANFAGTTYTEVYVNNNGNVTFDQPYGAFTDFDYWVPERVIVAPLLADVDTRGTGSGAVTYGQTTYDGQPAFCVNWIDVGYFDAHADKRNSFQLLLVAHGPDGAFDIVFNYDTVQWETGDSDGAANGFGGISASWGYASGEGEAAHVGAGSFLNGALLDGGPAALSAHSHNSTQPGRYVYPITAPTGPALTGQVTEDGIPVAFSPVEICTGTTGDLCITRSTNAAGQYRATGLSGTYHLTAFPPWTSERNRGHAGPVIVDTADVIQDIALGTEPLPPPDGTTVTSPWTTEAGVPVIFADGGAQVTIDACPGGWVTGVFRDSRGEIIGSTGGIREDPPGTYTTALLGSSRSGNKLIQITADCPSPADDLQVEFDYYVLTTGYILDTADHYALLGGAEVMLLRASAPAGPFTPVPPGSALFSPANRFNPDVASPDGRFGWDLPSGGYYKIQASKSGCVSDANRTSRVAETNALTIPPNPLIYLHLYCPLPPGPTAPSSPGPSPPPPPAAAPTAPAAAPPPAVRDASAPTLRGLALKPPRFTVTSRRAGRTQPQTASRGSTITFQLSENSRVELTITVRTTGRLVGGVCKAQTKHNKSRKPCARWVRAGALTASNLTAGPHKLPFTGRIVGKPLRPGLHRLTATPTDVAGNRGVSRTTRFTILRR
jgi:hypothetical protein